MELIGHKTEALFDLWSFCHFFTGVAIGNFAIRRIAGDLYTSRKKLFAPFSLMFVLALAYLWEFCEIAMELGYAGQFISYWFQGREHWGNRLLSDPLLVLIGFVFGLKFQRLIWPARVIVVTWLLLFVFVFPHSMAYM